MTLSRTLLLSLVLVLAACDDPSLPEPRITESGMTLPDFTLTDHDGKEFTRDSLKGRVTILDFFFTDCPFICPTLATRMGDLAANLKGTPVRFLSISVNPERDTPEKLRAYAALHEADTTRWTFASGPMPTVRAMAGGLKFALEVQESRQIPLEDGASMANIAHPPYFILVNANAEVVEIYDAMDPDAPQQMRTLESRARAIADTLN